MKILFDMDGTLYSLYSVPNWLSKLRTYDPEPYTSASPLCDMSKLKNVISSLRKAGHEVEVVSWLSKESTPEYNKLVRAAKRQALARDGLDFDKIHLVKYGTPKSKYRGKGETILIDDDAKVRAQFSKFDNCRAVSPEQMDIIDYLSKFL